MRTRRAWLVGLLLAVSLPALSCATTRPEQRQDSDSRAGTAIQAPSRPVSGLRYTVRFDSVTAASRRLEVSLEFAPQAGSRDPVILALPRWTPGSYRLGEFAQFVLDFRAETGGTPLRWERVGPESWAVWVGEAATASVSFAYVADSLDNAFAWSQPDFAFFNGTNVFLYPAGAELDRVEAELTIVTEPGWRIATGMTPGVARRTYREASYHDLVDKPVFIGRFDLDSMRIAERWTYLATYPSGALAGGHRDEFWRQQMQMIPPMARVFGEIPYDSYWTMLIFAAGKGSALEHQNSHTGLYDPGFIGSLVIPDITAHEVFHLWNVKRLRPAGLVPYRYDVRQPTSLLWISEGTTDYYASLALVRGGIVDSSGFLALLSDKLREFEAAPAAALHDVSVATWAGASDGTRYLYYPGGALASLLLDILIRDGSDGSRSLDDVMRTLYESRYMDGRGFTDSDFWDAAGAAAGRDLRFFRDRWVAGREPLPLDSVLPLAGLRARTDSARIPLLGVTLDDDLLGVRVSSLALGGIADGAGVRPGDIILSIGSVRGRNHQQLAAEYQARYAGADGELVPIVVLRDGVERRLDARLHSTLVVRRSIGFHPAAEDRAVRLRTGLLAGGG